MKTAVLLLYNLMFLIIVAPAQEINPKISYQQNDTLYTYNAQQIRQIVIEVQTIKAMLESVENQNQILKKASIIKDSYLIIQKEQIKTLKKLTYYLDEQIKLQKQIIEDITKEKEK
jgi:hypothetical protein